MTKQKPPRPNIDQSLKRLDDDVLFPEDKPLEEIDPEPLPKRSRKSNGYSQHGLEPLPPTFSESALASRFVERHADQLRYTAAWGKWHVLLPNGKWQIDEKLHAFDLAHIVCREASTEPDSDKVASAIARAKTVAAVLTLAKADNSIAAGVDQWDSDPWLLNTPHGAIDLRNAGKPRPRPAAYCTKQTAVAPGGECPLWHAFLDRVTGGDLEFKLFLQRMAGYCLTGSTEEHALFFLWGTGANGKSVFLITLSGVLGDYAKTAPIETFTATGAEEEPYWRR